MNRKEKAERIRKLEEALVYANPLAAAKIARELVRLKAHFFDEE